VHIKPTGAGSVEIAPTSTGSINNMVIGNVTPAAVSATTVSASGNITGNYFIGNGSQLTGLPATYSNANVATFLANFGSNTISTTGNISGGYLLGNGSQLTGISTNTSKIFNGTSQANIGTANGNIVFTVAGANIVTVSSSGIVNNQANGVGNIGGPGAYFNTIHAQATSAQYADVAERFAADADYDAGTVVELGGSAEITKVGADLSDKVFGVISTRAAYLMNAGAGTDNTHPPVAMTGRVPVKVVGPVNKGDRLVSAGNGIARSAKPGEAGAFNTIGRALADKLDLGLGTVEAIVTIK
jgi:hypothetical protein